MLGADCNSLQSKAMAAFLSGEMKDTVQMNPAGSYGQPIHHFFTDKS